MNELVIMHGQQAVTTSLKVAEVFGKEHRNVMQSIKNLTAENSAVKKMFAESTYVNNRGQEWPMFYMNRDGFTLLAMGFSGAKAMGFKLQYIEAFNAMEHRLTTEQDSYMIADPIERAKRWIEEQKALKETQKQLEIAKPKVLFADSVASSETTILIGVLAKIIKQNGVEYLTVAGKQKLMGQNNFFKWLRENGYLISRKGDSWNTPTQKAMDMGLFEVKESTTPNPDGSVRITKTTKVTGKGQQYFINKLLGENAA
ncbi:phage regulatory protein/antirepressor Ant [Lactobacillus delbrueckii subsp. lactis]|uniref:phage regulatory protein/antirepressor Ant n=1 Tax=Lactobacillus delbrueckii TaxID=1584 RepID=UPI001E3BDA83|nr:phage regulatory protein/antirepressor Ant [Lactobacillus delbrueckii]MCD5439802.1 phage regulatory protein/antirepressor Ant [Lactobacillus delbrueckii subsp. lactis]MCD5531041.1 phage regulatory protein/antirepressor Ant [Lactobacillus delbrueckii subsp. lactis]MCS8615951.1 phage regulatory protein/antirepressor Ant [Lactobacillus delbrueckii subsp. lactis]